MVASRFFPPDSSSAPAVQLVEGVEAALEVGEKCELRALLLSAPPRDRAQQLRDAGEPGDTVFCFEVIQDLRLEVREAQVGDSDAARAARPEYHVALSEPGPPAEEPRRLDRGGEFLCGHARS